MSRSSELVTNYDRFCARESEIELGKSLSANELTGVGMAID